jgi:hypothetical protein
LADGQHALFPVGGVGNPEADRSRSSGNHGHAFVSCGVVVRLDVWAVAGDPLGLPPIA